LEAGALAVRFAQALSFRVSTVDVSIAVRERGDSERAALPERNFASDSQPNRKRIARDVSM